MRGTETRDSLFFAEIIFNYNEDIARLQKARDEYIEQWRTELGLTAEQTEQAYAEHYHDLKSRKAV